MKIVNCARRKMCWRDFSRILHIYIHLHCFVNQFIEAMSKKHDFHHQAKHARPFQDGWRYGYHIKSG